MNRIGFMVALMLSFLLSGCASVDMMQKDLSANNQITKSYEDMNFEKLENSKEISISFESKSPTYLFEEGKKYYAALSIPEPRQPRLINIKTYLTSSYLPSASILVPQLIYLNSSKQTIGKAKDFKLYPDSDFWLGGFFTADVSVPADASYIVVHAADSNSQTLDVYSENGTQYDLPLAPAGKIKLTLGEPLPSDYVFSKAIIKDSVLVHDKGKADIFFVGEINNKATKNSLETTAKTNQGRGFNMETRIVDREVPANKPCELTIVARTHFAAPILALTNKVYQVKGQIKFVPEKGKTYVVRGELEESHSSVWVEEETTQNIIDKKIEVNGSAELGFFSK